MSPKDCRQLMAFDPLGVGLVLARNDAKEARFVRRLSAFNLDLQTVWCPNQHKLFWSSLVAAQHLCGILFPGLLSASGRSLSAARRLQVHLLQRPSSLLASLVNLVVIDASTHKSCFRVSHSAGRHQTGRHCAICQQHELQGVA